MLFSSCSTHCALFLGLKSIKYHTKTHGKSIETEGMMAIPFTISIPTVHGQMLVNRYDVNQTNSLIKTVADTNILQIDIAQHICNLALNRVLC
jgi:hypothetical protein